MKITQKKVDVTLKVIAVIATIVVWTLILLVVNAALNKNWRMSNMISNQPNTQWMSEDGSVVFFVDSDGKSVGKINIGDKEFDFYLTNFMGVEMELYPISVLEEDVIDVNSKYENWSCSYKSDEKIVATVKKTTFFKEGQKITFYRIDDENQ